MEPLDPKVQKIVDKAVEDYPKAWTRHICAFTVIDKKTGNDIDRGSREGDVCHASVSAAGRTPSVVVNAHKANWMKKHPEFLRWLVLEGPFNHGIRNKDDVDYLLAHATAIDSEEVGGGGVLWQCKAARHFEEDSYKLKYWDQLRGYGLNGLQAFFGADILQECGSPSFGTTHTSLIPYTSPVELRKWYDELLVAKELPNMAAAKYGNGRDNWGSLKGKNIKKKDGWGGFIEVAQPCDPKDYANLLKEIFEGDPKNVG